MSAEKVLATPYQLEETGQPHGRRHHQRSPLRRALFTVTAVGGLLLFSQAYLDPKIRPRSVRVPLHAEETLAKCRMQDIPPGPPPDFALRTESDRYVPGTKATLIKNATIWTGRENGLDIVTGDLLLDKGMIKAIGQVDPGVLASFASDELTSYDVHGAWVSPG